MPVVHKQHRDWNDQLVYDACKLCLVTDFRWLGKRLLHTCVADAVVGGASMVDLKMSDSNVHHVISQARKIIPICRVANIPFIISDNIGAAKASRADGIHLSNLEYHCDKIRKDFGRNVIVGVSVHNVQEAEYAAFNGASYLTVGPIFSGGSSKNRDLLDVEVLKEICETVEIPVMAAGGVTLDNMSELTGTGACGICCTTSILASPDIEKATRDLSSEVNSYLRSSNIL